jgi:hypothetical protein
MEGPECGTYRVMDRTVRVPVQVRAASALSATYLANSARVGSWIADSGLQVIELLPGRTLVSIAGLRYADGDWGSYHEVCIAVPVFAPDVARASTSALRAQRKVSGLRSVFSALRNGQWGLFLRYLPVTDAFSCQAGVSVYGFPKWLADIELREASDGAICSFVSHEKFVFSLAVRLGAAQERKFGPVSVAAYSVQEGQLHRCRFTLEGERVGVRAGGARLTLGSHRIAGELSELSLSRHALCVSRIGRMRAEFGAPELVGKVQ